MDNLDRVVAGLACREVLHDLTELIEGSLAPERLEQVGRHVAACHVCEAFGGHFARVVTAVRQELSVVPIPAEAAARLRARLRHEVS